METHEEAELCFPELLNTSCLKPVVSQTNAVVYHILLFTLSPLTVALNLMVIISVAHFRQLHTPTNLLLLSLAVSDLFVGLVMIPGEILRNMTCWFLGDSMCSLCTFLAWLSVSASVGDMVLISVDRYVAICDPLHYTNKVTVKRVKVCICLCWFCSGCYCFGILKDNLTHPGKYHICQGECMISINLVAEVVDLVSTFILPICAIIALYMSVFVVAVSQARAMRSHITSITAQRSGKAVANKSELKAARSLGVLVVVFLICFCPYYCVYLAADTSVTVTVYFYLKFLMFFNSCLNPLIYSLFYPWFRKSVKQIFTMQILQPDSRNINIL
ncbi:trace amine-associated receptor 13c-like [Sphaeramia orbicularis]|uniref:trace amine-associated receptor 13c-like n=1 Tax=Sphaeramia orbicularis TaxID=375764 RepID=UPI00117C9F0F|nr:trace amine-associated receptor 13c-like [Sphaeramia orbicularis]